MKGKPKSYLSCIPDVVSYDIDPSKDDFILLSTDGIFQSMSISEIVSQIVNPRQILSKTSTLNLKLKRVRTRSSAVSFKIAKSSLLTVTTWR